jgi:hypothetical protein
LSSATRFLTKTGLRFHGIVGPVYTANRTITSRAMAAFDHTFVTDLVGHIYEAAVDADHWDQFLAALETVFPDSRITLFGHENGRPCAELTRRRNFSDDDLRAYVDHHIKTSPYIAAVSRLPVGKAIYSELSIRDNELVKTEHYNEYVKPRRLGHYATGVVIERRPGRITALSIADHRDDAERRASQIRLIDDLAPHFARARSGCTASSPPTRSTARRPRRHSIAGRMRRLCSMPGAGRW